MKVRIEIDPNIAEDRVMIEVRALTPVISDWVAYTKRLDTVPTNLTVKKGEDIYFLDWDDIYTLYLENRILQAKTKDDCYKSSLRLYQVKEMLPQYFLQISQSEIINLHQLDHLQVTTNGLVKLVFKNREVTYSSRRYLKHIKEALHL
ncbi:LytTR family DNA-binding domain-containing protein [Streptococcus respiraculi]|uniref:LytTR family DNA-binding domain-containing protein n=1 Tax=Streptococcus respiraculi TaxID=2021971 RepID=UPI000E76A6BB|nr:LytTR family DNA-binding domain-containing protein [Streptococcus respiraculi]